LLRALLAGLAIVLTTSAGTGVAVAASQTGAEPGLMSRGGTPKTALPSSLTLDQTDPHLGSTVTFTVEAPRSVKAPRVSVMCSQGTTLVYGEAGTFDHAFVLGGASSLWLELGGPVDCDADLFYWDYVGQQQVYVWLANVTFSAGG
jgi:hypothetical protein